MTLNSRSSCLHLWCAGTHRCVPAMSIKPDDNGQSCSPQAGLCQLAITTMNHRLRQVSVQRTPCHICGSGWDWGLLSFNTVTTSDWSPPPWPSSLEVLLVLPGRRLLHVPIHALTPSQNVMSMGAGKPLPGAPLEQSPILPTGRT